LQERRPRNMRTVVIEIGLQCAVLATTINAAEIPRVESPPAQQSRNVKTLRIDHQTSPIGTGLIIGDFYRVEITGTIIAGKKGTGEIGFESILPKLDDFGDRVSRNLVRTKAQVRFSLVDQVDATGRGRTIYEIEVIGARPGGPRFLLVIDEKQVPCRLVIKDGKEHHTATTLAPKDEDLPSAKQKS
jgi:hypothetical protein